MKDKILLSSEIWIKLLIYKLILIFFENKQSTYIFMLNSNFSNIALNEKLFIGLKSTNLNEREINLIIPWLNSFKDKKNTHNRINNTKWIENYDQNKLWISYIWITSNYLRGYL